MIPNYRKYKEQLAFPQRAVGFTKSSVTTTAGRCYSLWDQTPNAGADPTTAAACTNSLAGALTSNTAITAGKILRFLGSDICSSSTSVLFVLCDRLSHQGGLLWNTKAGQVTNLPTAALTRYTTGTGVYAAFETYTGSTDVTYPCSFIFRYTNELGVANRMTYPSDNNKAGYSLARRFLIAPLFQGDRGVRSVEEFQLVQAGNSSSGGGAGGVTLFKPLVYLPVYAANYMHSIDAVLGAGSNFVQIQSTACLFWLAFTYSTSTGTVIGSTYLGED